MAFISSTPADGNLTPGEATASKIGTGIMVFLGVYFVLLALRNDWVAKNLAPSPYVAGALALGFIWFTYVAATGHWGIWNSVRGEDGRASTSRFQVSLWTAVVVFSWVAIAIKGFDPTHLPQIPQNMLIALGISVGTGAAAAAVTSSNVATGKEVKVPASEQGMAPLFQSDTGLPDIGKIQLISWTFIAVAVYLGAVSLYLADSSKFVDAAGDRMLPDIDPGLMALTGLGSAAYLGKKLVTTAGTYIGTISTNRAFVGEQITLTGRNFGSTQDGGRVVIDGTPIETPAATWTDTMVKIAIPETKPDNGLWKLDVPVDVTIYGASGPSANSMKLTLVASEITSVAPPNAHVGDTITITGRGLGDVSSVSFGGPTATAHPTAATDTSLTVTVPPGAASGPVSVTSQRGMATSTSPFTVDV